MQKTLFTVAFVLLAFSNSSCDTLFGAPTIVEGIVTETDTGRPFVGVSVILAITGGPGALTVFASDVTDASGSFRLRYDDDVDGTTILDVFANKTVYGSDLPTDDCYGDWFGSVPEGKRSNKSIRLRKVLCGDQPCRPECADTGR